MFTLQLLPPASIRLRICRCVVDEHTYTYLHVNNRASVKFKWSRRNKNQRARLDALMLEFRISSFGKLKQSLLTVCNTSWLFSEFFKSFFKTRRLVGNFLIFKFLKYQFPIKFQFFSYLYGWKKVRCVWSHNNIPALRFRFNSPYENPRRNASSNFSAFPPRRTVPIKELNRDKNRWSISPPDL